jgi:hypothetical protein
MTEPAPLQPDSDVDFQDHSVAGRLNVARWAADEACSAHFEPAIGYLIDAVRALADAIEAKEVP